jgi:hypothetical protein
MDGSYKAAFNLSNNGDKRRAVLHALENNGVLNAVDTRHVAALLDDNSDPLDQIICKLGLVSEDRLACAYADIFSLPYYPETPKKLRSARYSGGDKGP